MLKNYFKISLRLFIREKGFTIINLMGLSVGLALGFLSLLYLRYELNYDQFHSRADQIYRIHQKFNDGGITANCSYPIGPALVEEYSSITNMTRFATAGLRFVTDEKKFIEDILVADSTFPDVFDLEFVIGSAKDGNREPNYIILTEEVAKRFYGDKDPLDKIIRIDGFDEGPPLIVKGVVKKFPPNSHFRFGILGNLRLAPFIEEAENNPNWNNPIVHTYVTIPDKRAAKEFMENRLEPFVQKYFPSAIGDGAWLPVMPLKKIHLESHEYYELGGNSNYYFLLGVSGIGFLILLLASINYMNLAAARSLNRLKEIGVRKVVGAFRKDLIQQFLWEAMLLAIISSLIAALLAWAIIPWLNDFGHMELKFNPFRDGLNLLLLLFFGLVVGLFSGLYPALFLSSFPTIWIMRNQLGSGSGSSVARNFLVGLQLVVVGFFFVCIYTIGSQMSFMANSDLGFDEDKVVFVRYSDVMNETPSKSETFIQELRKHHNVEKVTKCWGMPGGNFTNYSHNRVNYEGMPKEENIGIGLMTGDENYIGAMGLELLDGRNLDESIASDTNNLLVNETLVREFGWEDEGAVGKEIEFEFMKSRVVGVIEDFHFESLHTPIKPMSIRLSPYGYWAAGVRIGDGDFQETIDFIRGEWLKYDDGWPFEIRLLADGIQQQYEAEEKLLSLLKFLTIIAVFLSAVGLLSNISFNAQRRVKEIGIRKVLGANFGQLFLSLSKNTIVQVGVSLLISFPLAFFLMQSWLQQFTYRINIDPMLFAISALTMVLISILSISYTVIKAATANPVDAIKME